MSPPQHPPRWSPPRPSCLRSRRRCVAVRWCLAAHRLETVLHIHKQSSQSFAVSPSPQHRTMSLYMGAHPGTVCKSRARGLSGGGEDINANCPRCRLGLPQTGGCPSRPRVVVRVGSNESCHRHHLQRRHHHYHANGNSKCIRLHLTMHSLDGVGASQFTA